MLRNKASYLLATLVQVNRSRVFSRAADSFFVSSFGLSRARRIGRAYASGLWLATKNPSSMDTASLLFGMSQTTGTVPDDIASRIVVGKPSIRDGRKYTHAFWYSSTSFDASDICPT